MTVEDLWIDILRGYQFLIHKDPERFGLPVIDTLTRSQYTNQVCLDWISYTEVHGTLLAFYWGDCDFNNIPTAINLLTKRNLYDS